MIKEDQLVLLTQSESRNYYSTTYCSSYCSSAVSFIVKGMSSPRIYDNFGSHISHFTLYSVFSVVSRSSRRQSSGPFRNNIQYCTYSTLPVPVDIVETAIDRLHSVACSIVDEQIRCFILRKRRLNRTLHLWHSAFLLLAS